MNSHKTARFVSFQQGCPDLSGRLGGRNDSFIHNTSAAGCRVCVETLGCKLNQAESEALARQIQRAGGRLAPSGAPADVCVVNTCSVTHVADRKSRQLLRQARRANPGALVVALGCYAQETVKDAELAQLADLLLGGEDREQLVSVLAQRGLLPADGCAPDAVSGLRTRSFVKVQGGCDTPCSYCVVPRLRGRERSRPLPEVVAEVRARAAEGHQEVVLTGTNVGRYDWNGCDLAALVRAVLEGSEIGRLRLSSLQPQDLAPSLLDAWRDSRLCRHAHLPLQRASDSVLRRMRRRYDVQGFRRAVAQLRQAAPDIAITTDVVVGFPGESQAEFEESYDLCRETGFAGIHVFPYSPRRGTEAARMPGQVKAQDKAERKRLMLELAAQSARAFRQRFLGRSLAVLWEARSHDGAWNGLTDNYIRVFARSQSDLSNRLLPARLVAERDGGLWAEVTET